MSAGHSYEMVMDEYSYDEARVHYEAVLRCRAETTRHWVTAIRVASGAKKRELNRYFKQLEETGKRLDLALGRRAEVNPESFFSALDGLVQSKKGRGDGNSRRTPS